jgi:hypothetical protein
MVNLNFHNTEPSCFWGPPAGIDEFETWRDSEGNVCAYGFSTEGRDWMQFAGLARFGFASGSDDVVVLSGEQTPREVLVDAYYRSVLPMRLQTSGVEVLHASAIRFRTGVVAFCAVSETGKSTLAHAFSTFGHALWADDAFAVEFSESSIQSIPLPFYLRLRPQSQEHFHICPTRESDFGFPKVPGAAEGKRQPVKAICALERCASGDSTSITRITSASAFATLLTHSYCFTMRDPARKRQMMIDYLRLSREVPVLRVRFRPDLSGLSLLVQEISEVLEKLG